MRIEAIKVRNLGPFADFSVDLSTLPETARVVAITGRNGAGKSTLLELASGGALYRQCATRGSLASLATARDAMLEVRVVNGRRWTLRHLVDAVSGKGESVALDESGVTQTPDGKVTSFDAFARRTFLPSEVLYSSIVSPQGSGGFLELKAGERKATLLRILGVERLEAMAKEARDNARAKQGEATTLEARIGDEELRGGSVDDAKHALDAAVKRAAQALEAVRLAELEVAAAREHSSDSAAARLRYEELVAKRADLVRRSDGAHKTLADLSRRIENNRAVLADEKEIRSAVEKRSLLMGEAQELREQAGKLEGELRLLRQQHRTFLNMAEECRARVAEEEGRAQRLRSALAEAPAIEEAVGLLDAARRDVEYAESAARDAEKELERLRGMRLSGADERISALREGLTEIVAGATIYGEPVTDRASHANLTLAYDDSLLDRAAKFPVQLEEARETLADWNRRLSDRRDRLTQLNALAARLGRLDADRAALAEAEASVVRVTEAVAQARADADAIEARFAPLSAEVERIRLAVAGLDAEIEVLRPTVARAEPLVGARARLEELEPQAKALREDIERLLDQLSETPEPTPPSVGPDVARLEQAAAAAARIAQEEAKVAGAAEAALERAKASVVAVTALRGQLAAVRAEQSDWTRLGEDLGRDGLQAALIDAAVPELGELTNDLLRATVGSRWTVTFDTQRLSADGKKTLEGLEVRIIDTERGREAEASTFSGGERVLLGEAVSLALSMLACRRAGIERPTLVRDESGAALDPAAGRHYVAMLRRAADIVGADRVLVVSHSQEVQELCDERIAIN